MIHTLTFNPALDYIMKPKSLRLGAINRSESESISCGGKGINVKLRCGTENDIMALFNSTEW